MDASPGHAVNLPGRTLVRHGVPVEESSFPDIRNQIDVVHRLTEPTAYGPFPVPRAGMPTNIRETPVRCLVNKKYIFGTGCPPFFVLKKMSLQQVYFMSVPTAELQRLRLSGVMPVHTRSMSGTSASNIVRERAIIMRDILSTWSEDCLCFEYRPDVFQEIITRPSISSDPQYYLRQDDLEGTLFRVGAYNPDCFGALCQFHPIYNLARIFCETLEGRFRQLFEEYDKLRPTSANMEPSATLTQIVQDLHDYYERAEQDRAERRARETPDNPMLTRDIDRRFATMLVRQIRALCERSKVVSSFSETEPVRKKAKTAAVKPNQRSPRAPPTTKSYLFQEMLGNESHQGRPFFVLGVLEKCVPDSLVSLQSDQDGQPGMRSLLTLLESEGAAQEFQERFALLVTKEEEEDDDD